MLELVATASIITALVFFSSRRFRQREEGFVLEAGRWYEAYLDAGDLPCPWCRAATRENDTACPSCRRAFGSPLHQESRAGA